jgi:metal-responsive CopG/Arc/MetJ family transcriptional regulator
MTISIPPRMLEEFEEVRKAENRTRSELVREALRAYFERRVPMVEATKAERAAVRSGRVQIKRGDYVSLAQLHNELEPQNRKASQKRARKSPR